VPRGFDLLLPILEKDAGLRASFFRNLDWMVYAARRCAEPVGADASACDGRAWRAAAADLRVGSTETAPLATCVHYAVDRAGVVGLPVPGCELKLCRRGQARGAA